jgi:hypothetical protein
MSTPVNSSKDGDGYFVEMRQSHALNQNYITLTIISPQEPELEYTIPTRLLRELLTGGNCKRSESISIKG